MLKAIQEKLGALVGKDWHEVAAYQGALVDLFRRYYDGEHRLKLTAEMKKMMQITDDRLDRYNANYCDIVVHAMSDRLEVDAIAVSAGGDDGAGLADYLRGVLPAGADVGALVDGLQVQFGARSLAGDAAQGWLDGIMEANRFDALQIDVHIAMLRDGVTYVMAAWDEAKSQVVWAHEPAFDGDCGVLVVWDGKRQQLVAGVKIWRAGDAKLVNIYFADRVEYYALDGSDGTSEKLVDRKVPAATAREEGRLGVPIIPFMNKSGDRKRPKSELLNVIPLADSLNRGIVSMVMAAELTAFSIMLAKGIDVGGAVMPGMILKEIVKSNGVKVVPNDPDTSKALADYYNAVDLKKIEGSSLEQFIRVNDFFIEQIGAVSHTPLPQNVGKDTQSGEALKQKEVYLLGKVGRAQVQAGNAWEDLARLSARVQELFGTMKPPAIVSVSTRWKDAQIRNDGEIIASAEWYWSKGFLKQALRVMSQSSLATHKEADIDKLLAERREDSALDMDAKAQTTPGFAQFNPLQV